jgi:hypothetical protein
MVGMDAPPAAEDLAGPVVVAPAFGRRARAAQPSTEWPVFAPPVQLATGPLGVVQAADREIARQTAIRAQALAEFAATRPATVDRPQGTKGAMSPQRWAARPELLREVSEWATPEITIALSRSAGPAETMLDRALTLVHRLPGTLAALLAGALHEGHLWPMLDHVAPVRDAQVRAEIEAEVLRWAAGRVVTPAQLGEKARREVLTRDARDAARELTAALAESGITLRAAHTAGMGVLTVVASWPECLALLRTLGALADTLTDDPADIPGGPRTRGRKMIDALLDLVLRPGESDLPVVQVLLTVVAALPTLAGGDQPGEIDGEPVPAELVRELLAALTARGITLDTPADAPADGPATYPAGEPAAHTPAADPATDRADEPASGPSTRDADAEQPVAEDAPTEDALSGCAAATDGDGDGDGDDVCSGGPEGRLIPAEDMVGDPAWWEIVQREESAWAAELERRILAGEFDHLPPPGPIGTDPPDPVEQAAEQRWQDEFERRILAGELDDPDDPDHRDDPLPTGGAAPPPGAPVFPPADFGSATARGGWWALAEQAVNETGRALGQVLQSLSHADKLVHTAYRADLADEAAWRAGPGGRMSAATDALDALSACTSEQLRALNGLLDRPPGGGLADRPRLALTDALTGALLALTDLPALRRSAATGRALGPPGPTDDYRPGAELDRYLRARDRRCRMPGCRRRLHRPGGRRSRGRRLRG